MARVCRTEFKKISSHGSTFLRLAIIGKITNPDDDYEGASQSSRYDRPRQRVFTKKKIHTSTRLRERAVNAFRKAQTARLEALKSFVKCRGGNNHSG